MNSLTPRQIKNIVSARSGYELVAGSQWFFIVKNTNTQLYHAFKKDSYLKEDYSNENHDFESMADFSSHDYDALHEVCLQWKVFLEIASKNWSAEGLKVLSACAKKVDVLIEEGVVFHDNWFEIKCAAEKLVAAVINIDNAKTAKQLDVALFQLFTLLEQDLYSKYPLIGRYKHNAFGYLNIEKRKAEFFSQAVLFEKDEHFADLLNQMVKRIEKLEATNAALASNILDLTKLLQPVQNTKILVGNLANQAKSALKLNKKKDAGYENEYIKYAYYAYNRHIANV